MMESVTLFVSVDCLLGGLTEHPWSPDGFEVYPVPPER